MKPLILRLLIITINILLFFLASNSSSTVFAQTPSSFSFNDFTGGGAKTAGLPFQITITAKDEYGATLASFEGTATLTDSTETIYPTETSDFTGGVWTGNVYITEATTATVITASYSTVNDNSDSFSVAADSRIKFLTITTGNNQNGTVYSLLPTALTVKVVDPFNNSLSNVGVNFTVTSAPTEATGYSLSSSSGTSGSSGTVSTTLTLGRKAGTYIVAGSLNTGIPDTVHFYETASHDVLTSIDISPSVALVPAGGSYPFTAAGYDQFLNDVDISPTWSIVNSGGTIDSTGVFYAGTTQGTFLNTIRSVSGSVGSTATVTIIGTGVTASASATPAATSTSTSTATATSSTGTLSQVVIDPSVITALEDANIPIVATGVDIYGNAVANVNFTFEVTGNLGTLIQTAPDSVLLTTSESGIGTVTVTATQGDIVKVAKIVGSVGTGLNRRLVIEPIDTPQRVGEPFTISIAAKDSLNNFITDYTGPIVLADTTGTIDPAVAEPNDQGIWYVQAIIMLGHEQVSVYAAGDGMIGVSNIFEVEGEPRLTDIPPGGGAAASQGAGAGALSEIMGASVSAKLAEILKLNKYSLVRYIAAGLAAGLGILGAAVGGGIMASRGLEAIGRNPFAKAKVKMNFYLSISAIIIVAALAVLAAFLIVK